MTFTNKAAGEMARRVEALLAPVGLRAPLVATFHAMCARMLRQHARHLGYSPHFTIYDEDDRVALVKECMRAEELEDKSFTPGAAVHHISAAKNQMLSADDLEKTARGPARSSWPPCTGATRRACEAAGAVDFDDLLLLAVRLLDEVPEVLAWYRGLWRHVLVDEYQDTNRAQYRIVRLLTGEHRNICSWATPTSRSTGGGAPTSATSSTSSATTRAPGWSGSSRTIAPPGASSAAAGAVIANNTARKDKALWTENEEGERPGPLPRPGTSTRRPTSWPSAS